VQWDGAKLFSRSFTASVGVAFLAAAPAPTANAAGQRSEPIWWSRMPQKQSTVSHVALGRGSATPRLSSAAPSASTHLWLSYGTMGPSSPGPSPSSPASAEGAGAGGTDSAVRACAAKSQAASTGQQRPRSSEPGPPPAPHAAATPPKSSAERSRWHGGEEALDGDEELDGDCACESGNDGTSEPRAEGRTANARNSATARCADIAAGDVDQVAVAAGASESQEVVCECVAFLWGPPDGVLYLRPGLVSMR